MIFYKLFLPHQEHS